MPSSFGATAIAADPFALHWSLYPKTYIAPSIPEGISAIDGDLTKQEWLKAPWSDDFDDIRGANDAPPNERPSNACRTRVKMLWDDTYLYIGALLHSDMTVEAHFTERNSPIFQKDSDFEVFCDPSSSCHDYKEYEVNAINTVWNLMLNRPYRDGGEEHSGRIAKPGDKNYYDVKHQKSATKILQGKVNNDEGKATVWSVEIAMAHSDLLAFVENISPPVVGTKWRINFSRVEKKGAINWTWQPQVAWNAASQKFMGFVDMHLPDAWGYLVFGGTSARNDTSSKDNGARDLSWPGRLAAMNIYYAQHEYISRTGSFATTMSQLTQLINQAIVAPFEIGIETEKNGSEFVVTVKGNPDGSVVTVTDKRFIQVHHPDDSGDATAE